MGLPVRPRILVVSDESDTRIFLNNLLVAVGCEPVGAGSMEEGLRQACRPRPQVIILDVMMGGREGIRLYRKLKSSPELRTIPVIMLSAIDRDTFFTYERYLPAGSGLGTPEPEAYMIMPPEADELLQSVAAFTCSDIRIGKTEKSGRPQEK